MNNIARQTPRNREYLFLNTSKQMGIPEAIIEKDFWVCWILDYLFHRSQWKEDLAFKGGTSLSKSYDLIHRFSEDVDLILNCRVLGYSVKDSETFPSRTKQDFFNKKAVFETQAFLKEHFVPAIKKEILSELKGSAAFSIDENDPNTVIFTYPKSFSDSSILPWIRLEVGTLAAWTPSEKKMITPYAAKYYPESFQSNQYTEILTVSPERTFWEKITILHQEAHRPENKIFPRRYSRHYYDIYCMLKTDVKGDALNNPELLRKVVSFKDRYYPCGWANYKDAKVGTIKLMPSDHNFKKLEEDYKNMQSMIFGDKPSFTEIMDSIKNFENELNNSESAV
ncbi:hypothetical protein MmiAt1_09060 [Methanimicrococcus sp. At1]|uniref:Nucleotidyl transferase AbiEii/AbiGii toxin family protein n=1 Tax=Methanimicrococcus hacksteinii TaxID=3028293 RepID=A0ABU3VPJ1_9EURY|nr:nucleotidyl transferase AbiEii/AbiGii toxin family protein [Methanimicrococcus sp. At1]MDV0445332.1 hypothetical protein [Methanimicrococcus sp. At1]